MRVLLLLILILTSSLASAAPAEQVVSHLNNTIFACPERIWDGLDWTKLKIILITKSQNKKIELFAGLKTTTSLTANEQIPTTFDITHDQLTVNLDAFEDSRDAFALTIHEGFHAFGQKSLNYTTAGRDESYPLKSEPRIEREELARAIVGYFRGEVGALERAAGWHKRHKSSNEDLGSDIIEGSAEYVEKISLAILERGCNTADINLVDHAVESLANQGGDFDKAYEHYRIGALSFLLARPKFEFVLNRLDGKNTVLDIVFESIAADDNIYPDSLISHSAEMSIGMSNKRAEETISAVDTAISQGQPMMFVPFAKLQGSFVHQGSYLSKGKTYFQNVELEISGQRISGHALQTTACGGVTGFLVTIPVTSESPVAPLTCL